MPLPVAGAIFPGGVGGLFKGVSTAQIASLALAGVGALGAISSGIASQQAAEFNAAIARQNAEIERQRAALEEETERRRSRAILGAPRAQFSGAGVTLEGTPLLVQEETAAEAEFNALLVRQGGRLSAAKELARARAERFGGRAALSAGLFRAGSTLLTAGSERS